MNISVCMATYNGEQFIMEQITSILEQLDQDDEVIIVDDCSKDNTLNLLRGLNDPRLRFHPNERNMGHVFSFERAISLAQKDIVILADQDDTWVAGRVTLMADSLRDSGALLVSSNSYFMNKYGGDTDFSVAGIRASNSAKYFRNIVDIFRGQAFYFGCAMAFRKRLADLILPIPRFVESHDLWIALASNMVRSNVHLEEKTLYRRIHGSNASVVQRSLVLKIWARFIFLASIAVLWFRMQKLRFAG